MAVAKMLRTNTLTEAGFDDVRFGVYRVVVLMRCQKYAHKWLFEHGILHQPHAQIVWFIQKDIPLIEIGHGAQLQQCTRCLGFGHLLHVLIISTQNALHEMTNCKSVPQFGRLIEKELIILLPRILCGSPSCTGHNHDALAHDIPVYRITVRKRRERGWMHREPCVCDRILRYPGIYRMDRVPVDNQKQIDGDNVMSAF